MASDYSIRDSDKTVSVQGEGPEQAARAYAAERHPEARCLIRSAGSPGAFSLSVPRGEKAPGYLTRIIHVTEGQA